MVTDFQFLLTDNAIKQIHFILSQDKKDCYFRISVDGGGCSGFQYKFATTHIKNDDDIVLKCGEYHVLIDNISVPFIQKGQLDFVSTLMESAFEIKNPNAKSSCGCGVSFSV